MSWTFRRRIKIADGLQLNISKGGLSLTMGPRGARVTVGPKGSYLHLGLPGTGIYSRTKLGPSKSRKRTRINKNQEYETYLGSQYLFEQLDRLADTFAQAGETHNSGPRQIKQKVQWSSIKKTFILIILWALLVVCALIIVGCVGFMISEGYDSGSLIVSILFSTAVIGLLFKIRGISRQIIPTSTYKEGELELPPDDFMINLKEHIDREGKTFKRLILENFLAKAIREQADHEIRPLIDRCILALDKTQSTNIQRKKEQLDMLFNKQYESAAALTQDFIEELTDQERDRYEALCQAYSGIYRSQRKWLIQEEEDNNSVNSSAETLYTTTELSFSPASFWAIDIPFDYPSIPVSPIRRFHFFPRFVVEEDLRSHFRFRVYSLKDVVLFYEECSFHEEEDVPVDAEQIDTTYLYVNADGSPDRRHPDNRKIPIVLYGNISIEPFGYTLQFSNNAAAREFYEAYVALVAISPDVILTGDEITSRKRY